MSSRSSCRQAYSLIGGILLTFSFSTHASSFPSTTPQSPFWEALMLQPAVQGDIWTRMRDNFQWEIDAREPRVQKWIDYYRRYPGNITTIAERARPWLYWVVSELERRGMPGEIALLPFIESAYDPTARHAGGATGMWQFMPGTGDALGLRRDGTYDGRLDVIASTKAALDYIQQQADQWYEGDIELSLAAYNAGAGTVNKARRKAVASGKRGDYWDLRLPRQTMNYVPKLLALSRMIAEPDRYDIALPSIPNQPAFARVPVEGRIHLARVARMAGISRSRLEALNPALLQGTTLPSRAPELLVPHTAKNALVTHLAERREAFASEDRYRVRRGDSLSALAARYSVTVNELRRHNGLRSDVIRIGQMLSIPGRGEPDVGQDTLVRR
ncbi:membrane-bound lytic murein transglycosylase D [Modicisalibacter ilicicola DSM 19980]|uniref:Membrane-bound lytic murein transglycosylase D n=1 Tax=Modicisalibacter ilicicola DSM 19980 TaxID=1121942 RepID=A0A1M5E339_9GAMM|nr:transglycosylase SLT domain-containing protein [Halomonas ilicicola]SHF73580.1 membrane-bound lytic murein transglycosylase D [Halomonas ilicicola DSM 19980]